MALGGRQPLIAFDLESILVPEIWHCIAETMDIHELMVTTREISDYEELMQYRLNIVKQRQLNLNDILAIIEKIQPYAGARELLDALRAQFQVVIVTDTFRQFIPPLMRKLNHPLCFCHELLCNAKGGIENYHLLHKQQKFRTVKAFRSLGYKVVAVGDSWNDIAMLEAADVGILYSPPPSIIDQNKNFIVTENYCELQSAIYKEAGSSPVANKKPTRVFAPGVFDVFHIGHLNYIQAASELGDVLVVGVQDDRAVVETKGTKLVNSLPERIAIIEALSCVKETVSYLNVFQGQLLKNLAIDVFACGEDYAMGGGGATQLMIKYC